jgi:hypothetical protein
MPTHLATKFSVTGYDPFDARRELAANKDLRSRRLQAVPARAPTLRYLRYMIKARRSLRCSAMKPPGLVPMTTQVS